MGHHQSRMTKKKIAELAEKTSCELIKIKNKLKFWYQ